MRIKILPKAEQFNCHWYCTEVGKDYKVERFDKKTDCYIVIIRNKEHFVSKNHARLSK